MSFGAVDPHDDESVAAMVRECRPAWSVTSVDPIARGTDAIYLADVETPDSARTVVLKVAEFVDDKRFLREPRTLSLVDEQTDIPVPSVLAVRASHDDLPAPFFLMEAVGGVDPVDGVLDDGMRARLAEDSGRALAAIHDAWAGEPEGFGWADPREDTFAAVGEHDAWPAHYRSMAIEDGIDHFDGGRFADRAPALRERVETLAETLPDVEPVVRHNDWRPGNLRVDPETGGLVAALDWGAVAVGHDEYELAAVEEFLTDRAPLDDPLRERVRRALRDGYTDRRALPSGEDAERRRLAYLLASRITAMRWLPQWHAEATDAERDEQAAAHREFVDSVLTRLDELSA